MQAASNNKNSDKGFSILKDPGSAGMLAMGFGAFILPLYLNDEQAR
jgi:hypothetical protein